MEGITFLTAQPDKLTDYAMCGYKNPKNECFRSKAAWYKEHYSEGLRHIVMRHEKDGDVGGVEYTRGENAWRAVDAEGYLFIHCIYIMKKPYKGVGLGEELINQVIKAAKEEGKNGVAVLVRKGSWMASSDIFSKLGFETADTEKPDFSLMALRFDENAKMPSIKRNVVPKEYGKGLTLEISKQCPYVQKGLGEMAAVAKETLGIDMNIVELNSPRQAQKSTNPYSVYSLFYNGKLKADHPISSRRFQNILNKETG